MKLRKVRVCKRFTLTLLTGVVERIALKLQLENLEAKVDKGFDRLNYLIIGIVGTSVYFPPSYSGLALLISAS